MSSEDPSTIAADPDSLPATAGTAERKKHRGNRGGVKRRMGANGDDKSRPRHVMPAYLSEANSVMPYRAFGGSLSAPTRAAFGAPQKFGFFEQPTAVRPACPGLEKRGDGALRPPPVLAGSLNGRAPVPTMPSYFGSGTPIAPTAFSREHSFYSDTSLPQPSPMKPDHNGASYSTLSPLEPSFGSSSVMFSSPQGSGMGASGSAAAAPANTSVNELFAKMVWKKLDMIESPIRVSRLHTEIMNILQLAIAEEASQHQPYGQKDGGSM